MPWSSRPGRINGGVGARPAELEEAPEAINRGRVVQRGGARAGRDGRVAGRRGRQTVRRQQGEEERLGCW